MKKKKSIYGLLFVSLVIEFFAMMRSLNMRGLRGLDYLADSMLAFIISLLLLFTFYIVNKIIDYKTINRKK